MYLLVEAQAPGAFDDSPFGIIFINKFKNQTSSYR